MAIVRVFIPSPSSRSRAFEEPRTVGTLNDEAGSVPVPQANLGRDVQPRVLERATAGSLSRPGPAPLEAASCERSHEQEDQDDHSDDKGDDGNRASVHTVSQH